MSEWTNFEDAPPPKGEMFIWARRKHDGVWSLGLAYWTVNDTWTDAYGAPPSDATHWKLIGPPPCSARFYSI